MSFTCLKDKEGPNCHKTIFIQNNSLKNTYLYYANYYPDTSLPAGALNVDTNSVSYLKSNSTDSAFFFINTDCWEDALSDSRSYSNGVLEIFVLDANVVRDRAWSVIKKLIIYILNAMT